MSQWRLNVENQIKTLKTIFVLYDENHDGVLTLDEFQILMKMMLEREKAAEAEDNKNRGTDQEKTVVWNTKASLGQERHRGLRLFNEALDLSIQHFVREKELRAKDDDLMDHMRNIGAHDDEQLDKITPMAFTEVMMRNQVGGFGTSTLFSDLRFTLPEN